MPIPDPVEVEDGVTPVRLSDMQALQLAVNAIIGYLNEHSASIESGSGATGVTEQYVLDAIQDHANRDTEVHGGSGPDQRLLKAVGGGAFIFADRNATEVPVGVYDNDIRIAPPT